ncbi:putative ABC transporter ATP-binding protein [Stieleria varia]|uniref:Putative ABC transporter ATP-binding protein n=2 Tax=Stieleria varia TaxID=2528005 RepID=A0A5C5ZYK0_9BACT|nr:putative ABC transporter ATP-binding protein [Stieleria varia]
MLTAPRREPEASGGLLFYVWAMLAGLLVPVLVVMVGLIALQLEKGGLSEPLARLGTHLWIPLPVSLTGSPAMVQLTMLVGVSLAIAVLFSFAVWQHRRTADRRSLRIVKSLHKQVLRQSLRKAEVEGAAAQRFHAAHLIGEHLPELQQGLSFWFRAVPRSLLMLIGCVALALMVNIWLAVLAVISAVFLWRLYQWAHGGDEHELNQWEVPRARDRMAELVGQAPMLARLQAQGVADRAFESELEALHRRLDAEDAWQGRTWPLLFLATSVATAILVLGLGINLLDTDQGLSVPSALVLGLALTGAAVAAGRLLELRRNRGAYAQATDAVYAYLQRSDQISPSEQRVGFAGVREGVEIHDVTLGDSHGRPILSHLTLDFTKRTMVSLVGTDAISTQALMELLMGFGHPSAGQVLIDGIKLLEIHPTALAKNVMWIEPSGPLWDATVDENLRGGDDQINNSDLVEALESVGIYERIQRLPEGLSTYVTAGDSALSEETTYGIGIARALLHKPPILLVKEPQPPAEHIANDACLAALRKLVDSGTLVVILPRRLQTLRESDRVVLLNGANVVGEGKHAQLLSDSDLYRHLNYLLFNPYRPKRTRGIP